VSVQVQAGDCTSGPISSGPHLDGIGKQTKRGSFQKTGNAKTREKKKGHLAEKNLYQKYGITFDSFSGQKLF